MSPASTEVKGFYRRSVEERREVLREASGLASSDLAPWQPGPGLPSGLLERMIENVVGAFALPLGFATHFKVNGVDRFVPMALEEPSVVAAASNAARIARLRGGFSAQVTPPVMIGQVSLVGVPDPHAARVRILAAREELLKIANEKDPLLNRVGGGARDLEVHLRSTARGPLLVVHLLVDVRDAMGANAVNTMAEALAGELTRLSGGRVNLRIISNLAIHRLARASATFPREALEGEGRTGADVVEGILDAYEFARNDPFRCSTHNKGIMNGISAVAIATGNDFRALEAGAHSYAAFKAPPGGILSPLSTYETTPQGDLVGTLELPLAVGTIGGAAAVHPAAKLNLKILGVSGARELAEVMAAVGLAQNFAALRALANEGIQKGHMALHARNVAVTAGARPDEVDRVATRLVQEHVIRQDRAREVLEDLRRAGSSSP